MAKFYPSIEKIKKLKVPPTAGEMALMNFLWKILDDSYEIYFNPYLNGDRPDILIMRRGNGVMVIEVKDWNLDNFTLNEKKKWVYTPNGSVVKSPIDQVLKYKNNLFDLHVDQLLEKKIKDVRHFNIVACALYFHCASQEKVENLLVNPYVHDEKYQKFLKYNIDLFGNNSLNEDFFKEILIKRYLHPSSLSRYFTDDIYQNFKRLLSPTIHQQSEGEPYTYSQKQKEIINGKWENGELKIQLEQRVKGVFGSGKTTVLAARAVQAYKRALARTNNPRILILTYNITLKNFIHDKLMRVDETFPLENFIIINYHQFINAELNNLCIDFVIPSEKEIVEQLYNKYGRVYIDTSNKDELQKRKNEYISDYLERKYYGNVSLFEEHKAGIVKYDAVLIDEIQDYHRPWMEIIKQYFREPEGDYVLFGDVKQNIYGQPTEKKDVVTNVHGVNELKYCYRSDFKVRDLAQSFQRDIFKEKYEIDDFEENGKYGSLGLETDKEGYINYMYLQGEEPVNSLYNIIRGNILNKASNIAPNDITILGYTTNLLRTFDAYYRYASREKVNSMLETMEVMYMTHLNFIGKEESENSNNGWFNNICGHLKKKLFPNRKELYKDDIIKLRQHVAELFTIYDLYKKYQAKFEERLKEKCHECGISYEAFMAFNEHNEEQLAQFRKDVKGYNYKFIRDNKKIHFWMNSGTIKVSTINSFKGWESEVVFIILEPKYDKTTLFNLSFDELLYTGLTRCRRNLVIINYGNEEYDKKIRPVIEAVK